MIHKKKISSKIFIDGGDPSETAKAEQLLGFIDGQTTNPTLVANNPIVKKSLEKGEKFTKSEINGLYKKIIEEISAIVEWSVSIEPYADLKTSAEELLSQAVGMAEWSSKAWIKLPTTAQGLEAAKKAVANDMRVNMTLCFTQDQAAAIYAATKDAKYPVFVSPFVGRLDDRGENGMHLIENILKMYEKGDGHVMVLTASVRNFDHLMQALRLRSPIITLPFKVFEQWAGKRFMLPSDDHVNLPSQLASIPYKEISLDKKWYQYDLYHELTDDGVKRFAEDWNRLIR